MRSEFIYSDLVSINILPYYFGSFLYKKGHFWAMMQVSSVPPPHPNLGPSSSEVVTSWGSYWHFKLLHKWYNFREFASAASVFSPRFTLELCWCRSVEMDLKQLAVFIFVICEDVALAVENTFFPLMGKTSAPRGLWSFLKGGSSKRSFFLGSCESPIVWTEETCWNLNLPHAFQSFTLGVQEFKS